MAPRSMNRRPRDSSYTEDVAKRGLDAVRERKNSTGYDRTQRDQALALVASGARYPANAETDMYSDWRGTRGFMPSSYDINYGRTDEGKYAGFKTAGDLKAATLGYAEFEREQDRAQAQALAMLADQRLGTLEDEYTDKRINIPNDDKTKAWMQHMPQMGQVGEVPTATSAELEMLSRNAEVQDRIDADTRSVEQQERDNVAADEYNAALDQWLAENSDKYLTAQEFAGEVQDTPLRDYATIAGQAYGIDPMIVRGWYDEASQIGDFREQRDLESIDNYGMPYGEYEQALTDMQQQGQQAQEQYTADEEAAYRAEIEAFTGLPADDLLNGAKVGLADLYNTLASPDYQAYASEIMASENDPDTINEILDNVRAIDPMLYRVMTAQYGYLADAGDGG